MIKRWIALGMLIVPAATSQVSSYLGPGVMSRGSGDIGVRGGQMSDIRFFVNVNGFADTGLLPVSTDKEGNAVSAKALYGVEGSLGAYGTKQWRRVSLGLDYTGTYRHYTDSQYFNGSDHQLALGVTYQKSRRLVFDVRQLVGTVSRGNSGFVGSFAGVETAAFNPYTSLLFDNRSTYFNTGADVSVLMSVKTIFTLGGDGFALRRQSKALVGLNGWDGRGAIHRRLTRDTTLSGIYYRVHYDFPGAFGEANTNVYQASLAQAFGKFWTLSAGGGIYDTRVEGIRQIQLDPAVARILGITSGLQAFRVSARSPTVAVQLRRRFKTITLGADYSLGVAAGNGVYLTSKQELANGSLNYTGVRRLALTAFGGYAKLDSIGPGLQPYSGVDGGGGVTYAVTRIIHVYGRFDARQQQIDLAGFSRLSYRASIGLSFSPGKIPLSFW